MAMPRAMLFLAIFFVAACRQRNPPPPALEPERSEPGGAASAQSHRVSECDVAPGALCPGETLEARMLTIAKTYASWGKIDVRPRWAPMPCAPTWQPAAGDMYKSESPDGNAHGQKLYYLYASDADDYQRYQPPLPVPLGQTIVKEAWSAIEVPEIGARDALPAAHAREGSRAYRAGDPIGLFIMTRLDGALAGTDEGWAYGIVSADHAKVSAGAIAACVACHKSASRERLFGFNR